MGLSKSVSFRVVFLLSDQRRKSEPRRSVEVYLSDRTWYGVREAGFSIGRARWLRCWRLRREVMLGGVDVGNDEGRNFVSAAGEASALSVLAQECCRGEVRAPNGRPTDGNDVFWAVNC